MSFSTSRSSPKISYIISVGLFILIIVVSYLLIENRAMIKELDHDEHQFVASAYLLAREGKLPYLDYAYFHMPNLVFIYAGLFRFTSYKFLAARYFSAISAVLTVSVLYWVTFIIFRTRSLQLRLLMSVCAVVLLVANPLFRYVVGRAWNHDFSTLLAVLSTVILIGGFRKNLSGWWIFISGLLLSFAMGVRVSWVVMVPPFLFAMILFPKGRNLRQKLSTLIWFAVGGIFAMTPSIILFLKGPSRFIFGNLIYAYLNTTYRQETGFGQGMTLYTKIEYFLNFKEPGFTLFLFVLVFVVFVLSAIRFLNQREYDGISLFAIILIPSIFIGSLMPTPSFRQYFYAVVPFSIMAIMYQISKISLEETGPIFKGWPIIMVVVIAIFSGYYGLDDFSNSLNPDKKATWIPLQAHEIGEVIADKVDSGKILTLSPIFVIEADRDIYPEFVTGPFAWRIAYLVPQNLRFSLGILAPEDLRKFFREQPPAGILVGTAVPHLEVPFIQYADKQGYTPEDVSELQQIWLP